MKVWVVIRWTSPLDYYKSDVTEVVGVYSGEEKAEEAVRRLDKETGLPHIASGWILDQDDDSRKDIYQ